MFSLPNIVRLNEEAASREARREIQDQLESPHEYPCQVCQWSYYDQSDQIRKADYAYAWHDIFSDDAKGVFFLCEEHDGTTGDPLEGYFTCAACCRVIISNYSWEHYSVYDEDQGELCLPCALKQYLEAAENWIDPRAVRKVVVGVDSGELFDPSSGTLDLAASRHLIGVRMPIPESLHFSGNIELDAYTGRELAGSSSTYGAGSGEASALQKIEQLADDGYHRILVILDAGYQFSISIGLYVDSAERERIEQGQRLQANAYRNWEDQAVAA
jgi:hypothetical protein